MPTAAASWLPIRDITLEAEPGLFYPPVMQAQRDKQIYALYGQAKSGGNITAPFFPSSVALLKAAVGSEIATTGTAPTSANTLNGAVSAGATTVILTSATGYTVNSFIQLGTSGSAQTEVRKITNVATNTLTLDTALSFAHTNGQATYVVTAPFSHYINPSNTLDSLTIEKSLGDYQSEQYPGCRVNKVSFKSGASNEELNYTADVMGLRPQVLDTPSTPSFAYDSPFVFGEGTINLFGTQIATVTDLTFEVENGIKETYTHGAQGGATYWAGTTAYALNALVVPDTPNGYFYKCTTAGTSGSSAPSFPTTIGNTVTDGGTLVWTCVGVSGPSFPQFITPVTIHVAGSLKVVYLSLDDANVGYFTKMLPGTAVQGALTASWLHQSNNYALTLSAPQVNFSKYSDSIKLEDVIITDLSFEASYDVSLAYSMQMVVKNGQWLPY